MKKINSSSEDVVIQKFINAFTEVKNRRESEVKQGLYDKFKISDNEFRDIFPNEILNPNNVLEKSSQLRILFGKSGEAEKLILALQQKQVTIAADSDVALKKYLKNTGSEIDSKHIEQMSPSQVRIAAASHAIILAGQAVSQFSDESLRFLYGDTIQMINQVAPLSKSESPLLIDGQINKMREGEVLEASWMYKGFDKEGEDIKYSDFHLVKFRGKTTLFCQKKNDEVFCGEVGSLQDIYNIITNVAGIKEDEYFGTEQAIKNGQFISPPSESRFKNIARPIFDDPVAPYLLQKLDQEVELNPFEKSLLLMISQVFIADNGISDKFKRPLNLQETKDFLRFLISGNIEAVEDPVFAARLILSDQEKLAKIKSVLGGDSSLVAEFFQGSQVDPFIQGRGFTLGRDYNFSSAKEEVKQRILSGELYCHCNGTLGSHYFGLVFGKSQDGRRKVYIQDSTESITEDIQQSYNQAIAKIYPDLDKVDIVKTMKKVDGAEIFSKDNFSIQNQCRYSSIIGSEKVIEKLTSGESVTRDSIRYGEEFFVEKMASWFDQTVIGQEVFSNQSRASHLKVGENSAKDNSFGQKSYTNEDAYIVTAYKIIKNNYESLSNEPEEAKKINKEILSNLNPAQRDEVLALDLGGKSRGTYANRIGSLISEFNNPPPNSQVSSTTAKQATDDGKSNDNGNCCVIS